MRLVKLLIAVITIHLGMGATQVAVSYHAGDVADYGAAGIISHTPIGTFIDLDATSQTGGQQTNLSNIRQAFDVVNNTGDAINGLASFGYGFLQEIEPEDGMVYTVVMGLRVASVLFWIGLGLSLLYILFDSNLLTSKIGLALVGLGIGLGGLSAVGALA